MARTKDREHIAEAVRKQTLWRIDDAGPSGHVLLSPYDEQLEIYYGSAGQVRWAIYQHWDSSNPSREVMTEDITQRKRERVLELINQKDVNQ